MRIMGLGKGISNVLKYWAFGSSGRTYQHYWCARCRGRECVVSEVYTVGSAWAALANIDNKNFCVVTCTHYRVSEFYSASAVDLDDLFLRQVR
jgi:predicted nucleic-acid-binding Zn-ribbon protein